MTTVAVMQPYFIPYAGYFRLFAVADVVVMFDCVQFPRRGWVHRNVLPRASGAPGWLTLPLAKSERDVLIRDLAFAPDAEARLERSMRKFPVLQEALAPESELMTRVKRLGGTSVTDYLSRLVGEFSDDLGLRKPIIRSSTLAIEPALRGQERVLAIVERLGGKRYVNPPGGRALYDAAAFAQRGVELHFFSPYAGSHASILTRLLAEPARAVAREIKAGSELSR